VELIESKLRLEGKRKSWLHGRYVESNGRHSRSSFYRLFEGAARWEPQDIEIICGILGIGHHQWINRYNTEQARFLMKFEMLTDEQQAAVNTIIDGMLIANK
jgi:hypothetical protein